MAISLDHWADGALGAALESSTKRKENGWGISTLNNDSFRLDGRRIDRKFVWVPAASHVKLV